MASDSDHQDPAQIDSAALSNNSGAEVNHGDENEGVTGSGPETCLPAAAALHGDAARNSERSGVSPDFFSMAVWMEGGLIGVALLLGWIGICDSRQSLSDFDGSRVLQPAFVWSLIAIVPMLWLLWVTLKSDWYLFRSLRQTVEEQLYPFLRELTLWKIVVISLLAGLGEELLFRWSLQGGLSEYLKFGGGEYLAALLIGLLFGLCHLVTPAYGILTFLIGFYLGLVMIWSGTYLAPALAHGFYDFVALLVIIRQGRRRENIEKNTGETESSGS